MAKLTVKDVELKGKKSLFALISMCRLKTELSQTTTVSQLLFQQSSIS